jgi:hypothetical protein
LHRFYFLFFLLSPIAPLTAGCASLDWGNDEGESVSFESDSDTGASSDETQHPDTNTGSESDIDSESDTDTEKPPQKSTEHEDETDTDTESSCFFDEDNDGFNDVIEQPQSDPKLCWRRCPIPATWNGTTCVGSGLSYTRSQAAEQCGARGYRVPTAADYTGPAVADGILLNCAISGPDNLDWDCDGCVQSPVCQLMFGDDTEKYWTSTSVQYWFETDWYAVDLAEGTLNFYRESHEYKVRCIR